MKPLSLPTGRLFILLTLVLSTLPCFSQSAPDVSGPGAVVFTREAVSKALGLSNEQEQEIRLLVQETRTLWQKAVEGNDQAKAQKLRIASKAKVIAMLSPAQKTRFEYLVRGEIPPTAPKPIQALLVTGGCCHDYPFQTKAMIAAAQKRDVEIQWKIVNEGKGTQAQIDLYDDPDWAEGFDVVIHNECFANTTNEGYIRRITSVHRTGVNAVVIHCAMHTYRAATIDDWREFLGVTSRHHEHQSEYPVTVVAHDHPIMKGFPSGYKTAKDELYVIEHLWPETTVLATSTSEKNQKVHPVFWTSRYGQARVFGTTYGHSNGTFSDDVFLTTLTRGIQWSAGRLE